jgi:hypothetical protein
MYKKLYHTSQSIAEKQLAKMVVEEYGKSSLNILDEAGADQSLAGQKGSNHKVVSNY